MTRKVSSELADSCDRQFCVCDQHIQKDEVETFESILEERYEVANDRTIKAHEDPPDETLPLYLEGEGEAFERFEGDGKESKDSSDFEVIYEIPPEVTVGWAKDYQVYELPPPIPEAKEAPDSSPSYWPLVAFALSLVLLIAVILLACYLARRQR